MKEKITVIVKEPHKEPELKTIRNDLSTMQELVGGYIEPVGLPGGGILVCDEEGLIKDTPFNCKVEGHMIFGTFFVCGLDPDDPENFGDVPIEWVHTFADQTGAVVRP